MKRVVTSGLRTKRPGAARVCLSFALSCAMVLGTAPAPALAEASDLLAGDAPAGAVEDQADQLSEAARALADELGAQLGDGATTKELAEALRARLAQTPLVDIEQDEDDAALLALVGGPSTRAGVARAYVLTARELGIECDQTADGVRVLLDGELVDVDLSSPEGTSLAGAPTDAATGDAAPEDGTTEETDEDGVDEGGPAEQDPTGQGTAEQDPVGQGAVDQPAQSPAPQDGATGAGAEAGTNAAGRAKDHNAADSATKTSGSAKKETTDVAKASNDKDETKATADKKDAAAKTDDALEAEASGSIRYRTHVQTYGWQGWRKNGQMSGTSGQAKRLEAIQIELPGTHSNGSVQYRTHIQGIGWQGWRSDGQLSGTSGQAKRLEAIQIQLTGTMANKYDVWYRVHAQSFGWLGWASNGDCAGTAGMSKRLEGIEIRLVRKGGAAPGSTDGAYRTPLIQYRTHVQSYGWQGWACDGAMSGTSGQSKRLEAVQINLMNQRYTGDIQYRTHVQGIGWQGWAENGGLAGTSGQSRRLEAIQIRLTGQMADKYDVWYHVHAQHFGWMGWAKNGASAGTEGYAYRLEGLEVKLLPKGSAAPGSTDNPFMKYVAPQSEYYMTATTFETTDFKVTVPSSWIGKWKYTGKRAQNRSGTAATWMFEQSPHGTYKGSDCGGGAIRTCPLKLSKNQYYKYLGKSSRGVYVYQSYDASAGFFTKGAQVTLK